MNDTYLLQKLTQSAEISAITPRIFNGPLPESAQLPAVTFEFVADSPVTTFQGDTGAARNRYTINAWANTYAQAQQLRKAIQREMSSHYRLSLVPLHTPKDRLYRFAIDYNLFHQEG